MYSIDNVQFKQLSPILELEVPVRALFKAVSALVGDHSDKSTELTKSWGDVEATKYTAISNQQGTLGEVPSASAHDLEKAFYNAKSVYFGLAMKDVFLSAAIKGAVTLEEISDYVAPEIRNTETVELLKALDMSALAKIVEHAVNSPANQPS